MSRASELTLFIILLQASIGFVDASGMFSAHYLTVPQNNASYTISNLDEYATSASTPPSILSEVDLFVHWAWDAFLIGLKILFAVIFVLPTLVTTFSVPVVLATFIQVGVYYLYATWYSQYKSGKGWKLYE